jgi:glutathione S-transferase
VKLYDYRPSGNGYKVRLALALLNLPYHYVPVDILKGETRTPEFLQRNPNGRIPLLQLDDGSYLAESNAILYYLAVNSALWPSARLEQAQVLQWLFFEQYSHEPYVATARFWVSIKKLEMNAENARLLAQKQALGNAALRIMDEHLRTRSYFVGGCYTIADIALYAYTHVAGEGGFDIGQYPAVSAWLQRLATQPRHVGIDDWLPSV